MAIIRYLGDRLLSNSASDVFPTDLLEGAILYSIPLDVEYSYYNNSWNAVRSGLAGTVNTVSGMTIYNAGVKFSGSYNIYNNGDVIGFGFPSNSPSPLNKGHFYTSPSGYVAGWVTGIILENQSNTGAFEDWDNLTTMSSSGDWGVLTAADTSGDWGNVLDPTTPGISIDVKLSQDRTTVSALRFRRLVSGSSNLDSTIEFWVMDSGTLLPKFWIKSGQFLPWLSGKNFLGAPDLPFSGIYTKKLIVEQVQINDGVIPSSGNTLTSTSGKLYWSGANIAVISGNTENAILVYNEDYPNAFAQTGVYINQGKLAIGKSTLPDYNLQIHGTSPSLGITSLSNTSEINMTNAIQDKCYFVYSGSGLETRVGSAILPTTTVRYGELDVSGFIRIRGNDNRTYQNALSTTSGQLYWSGSKVAVLSGNTANGLIKYDANYPNSAVQTGIVHVYDTALGGDTFGVGTNLPSYNLEVKANNANLGVSSTSTSAEIDMTNTVGNKCYFIYSGQKLDLRIGSTTTPTITIVGGEPGNIGFRTKEPRTDVELLRNSISTTQSDAYGIYLRNDTASTSSSNQYSPPLLWRGSFWNPTGLNSMSSEFRAYVSTSSGANPLVSGSGALVFEGQVNSSGYKELIRLDYDAGLKLASNRTFNSGIVFADHRGGLMEASGLSFDTGTNVLKIKTISGNQARYHVGGILHSNSRDNTATAGNPVTDLMTYTLPKNTLRSMGDRIEWYAAGTFNTSVGPNRVILEAFNDKIIDHSIASTTVSDFWTAKIQVYNIGTLAPQDVSVDYIFFTGSETLVSSKMRVALVTSGLSNSDTIFKIRGQSGVTVYQMYLNFYPGNDDPH